jgi:hypothetical protein
LKIIFHITIAFCFLTCCTSVNRPEKENNFIDTLSVQSKLSDNPKVDVKIYLPDAKLNSGDIIKLKIKLTNLSSTSQRLLFDKPVISTGGPWATSATVIDNKTKKIVLKYQNKSVLSSQVYSEEQLKDKYYNLIPNQSIEGKYNLTDIVVFNTDDNKLPKGSYTIQVFYYKNVSNSLTFTIE